MSLNVIVLAAGQGTRMRSDRPKVLHEIGGKALLGHVLDAARALAPKAIHVVYGHGADLVRSQFPDEDIRWCMQAEQLGTGHAVDQAMGGIADDERVLVLCGDVPLLRPEDLEALVALGAPLGIITVKLEDPTGYGRILRDASGAIKGIVEQRDAGASELAIDEVSTGIMAMDAKDLRRWLARLGNENAKGEYYLTDIVAMAAGEGLAIEATRASHADEVLGINDRRQLAAAERIFQRRQADSLLERGATLCDPSRIDVRGSVEIGKDVFIDVGVVLEGRVVLGDGARLGPYTLVRDAELGAGTVVHSHSHIVGAVTGTDCEIGPFARLRPGAELAEAVKAGNFVEIKKSKIDKGSKINHLTYIGDTTMGADVNIGAGTVTCNYDGADKHRTTIGSNVFVGSGVMLVAPVTIGDGATIGAGSTISEDVPAGELTVGRARQTTVEGWSRPVKQTK